jgi:hypothetical protein
MKQLNTEHSIYCDSRYGPTIGLNDIYISDYANTIPVRLAGSYSELGHSYQHPQPNQGESFLAGSEYFKLSEIEVYQKE